MFGHVELAIVDLLTEGKYAELMVRRPKTGGDITTCVWALYFSAGLLGAAITGPMADAGLIKEMFWIAIPMAAQVVIPVLFKCFPEVRHRVTAYCTGIPFPTWRFGVVSWGL